MDLKLRHLHSVLGLPSAISFGSDEGLLPKGWNFKKLVEGARARLTNGPWSDGFKKAGNDTLAEAMNVNEMRDRVVHDMWVERPDSDADAEPTMQRRQIVRNGSAFTVHVGDLDFINRVEERIYRTDIRVVEMAFYALDEVPGAPEVPGPPKSETLAIINGDFHLLNNGGYAPN